MVVDNMDEIELRLWDLVADNPREEIARALCELTPRVPPTPELRLRSAIFGERPADYTAPLVEIFMVLKKPRGQWEDYQQRCFTWVTGVLQDAVAHETELIKEPLHRLLDALPERLKKLLWLRFGFDGRGPKTLEQVGKEFGLTKERVRQLEAKALRMLRHPSRSNHLRHVLPGECLRSRLFAELWRCGATPAIFQLWEEDRETLLSLRKSCDEAIRKVREQGDASRREVERQLTRLKSLIRDIYRTPVTEVGLSRRVVDALTHYGPWAGDIPTLGEIAVLSDRELLAIRSFGEKALSEVREAVRRAVDNEEFVMESGQTALPVRIGDGNSPLEEDSHGNHHELGRQLRHPWTL